MKSMTAPVVGLALVLTAAVACTGEVADGPVKRARPVTVLTLAAGVPEVAGELTGVAKPHREEQVGFEVAGRVQLVVPIGQEVRGPTIAADGSVVEPGEVLAQLDPTRYEQALEVVRRRLTSAEKGLAAQDIELATVLQSDLDRAKAQAARAADQVRAAEAQANLSKVNLDRTRDLFSSGDASQQELDQRQAEYDNNEATLQAARSDATAAEAAEASAAANIQLKAANIEQAKADIAELEQQIVQAQQDLDDCTLLAPYSGRVTEKLVGRGGYAQAGSGVVTLTMMDPIKISATVTPERSRELLPGAAVAVFPKDLGRFTSDAVLYGHVYDKPEVADPSTRTYLIDVITRNLRRPETVLPEGEERRVHAIDRVMPVMLEDRLGDGPLHVPTGAVLREDGKTYVLRLPGLRFGGERSLSGVFQPERVEIDLQEHLFTILQWSFQQVADGAGLREGEVVILDPRPEYLEGVMISNYDWAIRPGDLVPLRLNAGRAPGGFYVPPEAVRTLNGEASVFAVDDSGVARRVPVTLHETVGMLRRVEGSGLQDGTRVVVEGVHYVADGEAVTVVPAIGQ